MTRALKTQLALVLLLALVSGCAGDKVTGPEDPGNGGGSVDPPVLALSDTSVQFPGMASGDGESELRNVLVHNRGGGLLGYAVEIDKPWVSFLVTPDLVEAGSFQLMTLRLDRARYTPGETARAVFSSEGGSAVLTITVADPPAAPRLQLSTTTLAFGASATQQTLSVRNAGEGALSWSVRSDQPWLSAAPSSGQTTTETDPVTVSIDRANLAPGSYSGVLTVEHDGEGGAATVGVTATVEATSTAIQVTNRLNHDVNIFVNGTAVGSVPRFETRQQDVGVLDRLEVSWVLVRPRIEGTNTPVGDEMGGVFTAVSSPGGTYEYTADHIVGTQWYFEPVVTNQTSHGLLMAVNWELQAENRCHCVVRLNHANVAIGYYRFFSNSNVVYFREGSNYTGEGWQWSPISSQNLEEGSGLLRLVATNSLPPSLSPGAEPMVSLATPLSPSRRATNRHDPTSEDVFRYRSIHDEGSNWETVMAESPMTPPSY